MSVKESGATSTQHYGGEVEATGEKEDLIFLVEDEENENVEVNHSLLCRVLGMKSGNPQAFTGMMKNLWCLAKGFEATQITRNNFLFQFNSGRDVRKVMPARPWFFERQLVLLQELTGDEQLSQIQLCKAPFWDRIYDVPWKARTEQNVLPICKKVGQYVEFDEDGVRGGGSFIRARIRVNVEKPLAKEIVMKRANGSSVRIYFRSGTRYNQVCMVSQSVGAIRMLANAISHLDQYHLRIPDMHSGAISHRAAQLLTEYRKALESKPPIRPPNTQPDATPWAKPPAGHIKINTDAALNSRGAGLGIVVQDDKGFLAAVKTIQGLDTAETAEAWGALFAIQMAQSLQNRAAESQPRPSLAATETKFIPTSETLSWLAGCAVGKLKDPTKMESMHLIWRLHGLEGVQISELGGDQIIACFPTREDMSRFLEIPPEWVPLWFRSLVPWQHGMRAVNRRCWLTLRGVPLSAWCHDFFEMVGSFFGKLLQVDEDTADRRFLGDACIQVLTEQGGAINRTLDATVAAQKCRIEVVESYFTAITNKRLYGGNPEADLESSAPPSEGGDGIEGREEFGEDKNNQAQSSAEIQGDPFGLMPIITKHVFGAATNAEFVGDALERKNRHGKILNGEGEGNLLAIQDPRNEGQRLVMSVTRVSTPTPPSHPQIDPVLSTNSFGPLAVHEAKAVRDERVAPRKKFKKVTDKGSLVTLESSTSSDIRRVNERLSETHEPVSSPVVENAQEASTNEALATVQVGNHLWWDISEVEQHTMSLAKKLVEKKIYEWCLSRQADSLLCGTRMTSSAVTDV
ncbi:hypothetical protein Tsubulata_050450 [Turnera subulata]|uniref:DUF4283 domain-containing protein n=1 Tax=Turnera subulata TaxID=218843 RepID=A0A9Q0FD15_9ROSI|nr:hypothetical protein Tsubulata_050450 [Turnera subulata]